MALIVGLVMAFMAEKRLYGQPRANARSALLRMGWAIYVLGRQARGLEPLGLERGVRFCSLVGLVWEACTTEVQPSVLSTPLVIKGPGTNSMPYCWGREGCG